MSRLRASQSEEQREAAHGQCEVVEQTSASNNQIIFNVQNIIHIYEWLSELAIFAIMNKDVDDLNFVFHNGINDTLHSFKSIDCITNKDEATKYPTEFLKLLGCAQLNTAQFTTYG